MSMNLIEFSKRCADIENLIQKKYIDKFHQCDPIIDGIINIEKYLSARIKLLWILKEPYDDVENGLPSGGGWRFSNDFLDRDDVYMRIGRSHATWHPVIYTSYGILNDFQSYNEMDYIRDDRTMAEIVRNIAIINVQKLPGFSRTYDYQRIRQAYIENQDILHEQISLYDPDIIIGGSTLQLFFDHFGMRENLQKHGCVDYAIWRSKLLIHAYHPAQTQVTRENYVNDILHVAKAWFNKYSNGANKNI